MRKVALIATILTCIAISQSTLAQGTTVFVTQHGKKYHRIGCREIRHSVGIVKMSIKDAKAKGLTPCKVCKPGDK